MAVRPKQREPVSPARGAGQVRPPVEMQLDVAKFASQCKALAAQLPDLAGEGRYDALIGLLRQAPCDRTREGRSVVAALVAELADRVQTEARRAHDANEASPDFGTSDLAWMHAGGHPHVTRALDVLRRCATEPAVCLERVAVAVGVSRWHLSRLLREWTGQSFFGLVSTIRVHKAKELLTETNLSIKEVAARCGYDHLSQLDHQFRRACGMTPGVYRVLWQVRPARVR